MRNFTVNLTDADGDQGQEFPEPEYNWPALGLFVIVIVAITGNLLVGLAVKLERKLRNMFNYFLVSLAVSDMLCAILVMPVSIMKAFYGMYPTMQFTFITFLSYCIYHKLSKI